MTLIPSDPPTRSTGDVAHAVVRAALAAIPVGGGTAVELFNLVLTPPLERRRHAWMISVGDALAELQEKSGYVDCKRLSEDEEFVSLLAAASQLAVKTHLRGKWEALQNAVLNAAIGRRPSEDEQETFLTLLDRFTPLHLRLLQTFEQGFVWSNEGYPVPNELELPPMLLPSIGSYSDYLHLDRTLLSIVIRDLITMEMVQHWIIVRITKSFEDGSFRCTVKQWKARSAAEMQVTHGVAIRVDSEPGRYVTRTTHLAGKFVSFMSRPQEV